MFEGLKNLGDLGGIMAKAQEMQTKAAELQTQLDDMEIEGGAGAGMVTAIATGKGKLKSLSIDPTLMKPEEAGVVEDLIVAAVADAQDKAAARAQEEMQKLMGDMPMPPGMLGG